MGNLKVSGSEEIRFNLFESELFGKVRTLRIDQEVYFVAKDVSESLGYEKLTKMYGHVDDEDKTEINPQSKCFQGLLQNGTTQLETNPNIFRMVIINESGLYSSIFGSKLESAKEFKKWVTKEVLPQIRKTGGYIPLEEGMSDLEVLSRAVLIANKTLELKDELISQLQPKAENYNLLMDTNNCIDFGEFVKSAKLKDGYGRNNFMQLLRDKKVLMQEAVIPYQALVTSKHFIVVQTVKNGHSNSKTLITKKGVDYLMKKCKEWNIIKEVA